MVVIMVIMVALVNMVTRVIMVKMVIMVAMDSMVVMVVMTMNIILVIPAPKRRSREMGERWTLCGSSTLPSYRSSRKGRPMTWGTPPNVLS